jgi:pimeloyl-ACP methyl ester carboxylesterase
MGASRVIVATPVAPRGVRNRLGDDVDEVVVVETPEPFYAIGRFYRDFSQTPDDEVQRLLEAYGEHSSLAVDEEVEIEVAGVSLSGHFTVPAGWKGIVLFAHGSGSSRNSPRNRSVALVLNRSGFGTLLFDLLSSGEEADRANVFDVEVLASRLVRVTDWLAAAVPAATGRVAFFGASTGAAAALVAAAELGDRVAAVVSRGGRPDLAGTSLRLVTAPTLLIVGGADGEVLGINRAAMRELRCESTLEVIPGAGHLFSEPGALEQVADLAADWFSRHSRPRP